MRRLPLAEALRVKRPCRLPWEALSPVAGEADERHCDRCDKVVRDISALTFAEAEALVLSKEARDEGLCGRVEQRVSDGAIRLADGYALPPRPLDGRKALTLAAAVASFGLAACSTHPMPVPELVAPLPVAAKPVPEKPVAERPVVAPPPLPVQAATPEEPEFGLAGGPEPEPPAQHPVAAKPTQASKASAPKPQPAKGKKKDKHVVILGDMY